MSQTFPSLEKLAEFLSNNVDKSFKIKTKFSHKEGKTEVQYYIVTECGDHKPKIYSVITDEGSRFRVSLKDEGDFDDYDAPLNYVFHYCFPCSHAVFVEAVSGLEAHKKGEALLRSHFITAQYAGITGDMLLLGLKGLYNTPWGYGDKIKDIRELTNIRISDTFFTDKTISIKFIADIH